jgi:hypothetical protein
MEKKGNTHERIEDNEKIETNHEGVENSHNFLFYYRRFFLYLFIHVNFFFRFC